MSNSPLGSTSFTARDAARPGATQRNPAQRGVRFDETNPIFSADPDPRLGPFAAFESAIGPVLRNLTPKLAAARNVAQPGATSRDRAQPNREPCKTKPIDASALSDPRQLAAARLLALGRSVPEAARELNLHRGTLWRWQREPAFQAELRRIHERMVAAAVPLTRRAEPRSTFR